MTNVGMPNVESASFVIRNSSVVIYKAPRRGIEPRLADSKSAVLIHHTRKVDWLSAVGQIPSCLAESR